MNFQLSALGLYASKYTQKFAYKLSLLILFSKMKLLYYILSHSILLGLLYTLHNMECYNIYNARMASQYKY